jgi:hypothetical protein
MGEMCVYGMCSFGLVEVSGACGYLDHDGLLEEDGRDEDEEDVVHEGQAQQHRGHLDVGEAHQAQEEDAQADAHRVLPHGTQHTEGPLNNHMEVKEGGASKAVGYQVACVSTVLWFTCRTHA